MDKARLLANIRRLLAARHQVTLREVIPEHPLQHGLAEVVTYLSLAAADGKAVFDESATECMPGGTSRGGSAWPVSAGDFQPVSRSRKASHATRTSPSLTQPARRLSQVVVTLMKGVVYQETDPNSWQQLLNLQARHRDYVAVLGLQLMIDEAEGYAWLRTREPEEGEEPLPRLVVRRQLSYPVSLIIALLRRKLAEADAGGGDTRLILSRDDVVEMVRTFLPAGANEARLVDQIKAHLNKIVDLGFIRRLRGQHLIEVRRILKAFVDAQWLNEFDARLKAYGPC